MKVDQLNNDVKKALAVIFCANTTAEDRINAIVNDVNDIAEDKKIIIDVKDYIMHSQCNSQRNS